MAFLFLLILTSCQNRRLDYKKIKVFTPAEIKQDTDYLFRTLDEVHISAWDFVSREKFSKTLKQLSDENFWLQSRLEIYRQLAPLIASLSETHTQLIYPEILATADGFFDADFPLYLLNEIDGLYVAGDRKGENIIPRGALIYSINGVEIEQLLSRMGQFVARETEAGQRRLVQMNFEQLLVRELGFQAPFSINWQLGFLKTNTIIKNKSSSTRYKRKRIEKKVTETQLMPSWGVKEIDAETRLLWITDFESPAEEFNHFLEKLFPQLEQQGVKSLIIDLRYNWGGISENVLNLLSYLQNQPITWAKQIKLKNTEIFRDSNSKRIKQVKNNKLGSNLDWLPIEYLSGWNWRLLFGDDGESIKEETGTEIIQLSENRYHGQLAIISNGYCFSACALFIDAIQRSGRGLVVGEAAGSRVGIQYGYPVRVTLPNTGLQLQLPAAEIRLTENSHKVLPDIQVYRRSEDIANQRDPELAAAISALKVLR